MLDLIFSKLGGLLALLAGAVAILLRGKWLKYRAERAEARAEAAEKRAEIAKGDLEIKERVGYEKTKAMGRVAAGSDFKSEFDRVRKLQGGENRD